ncbi:hypothetical protein FB451DRAFT_1436085 [Mycena latifolia]|nr:hypothetical protein FB451DRAFT_1436085 [Mycena latifolia]
MFDLHCASCGSDCASLVSPNVLPLPSTPMILPQSQEPPRLRVVAVASIAASDVCVPDFPFSGLCSMRRLDVGDTQPGTRGVQLTPETPVNPTTDASDAPQKAASFGEALSTSVAPLPSANVQTRGSPAAETALLDWVFGRWMEITIVVLTAILMAMWLAPTLVPATRAAEVIEVPRLFINTEPGGVLAEVIRAIPPPLPAQVPPVIEEGPALPAETQATLRPAALLEQPRPQTVDNDAGASPVVAPVEKRPTPLLPVLADGERQIIPSTPALPVPPPPLDGGSAGSATPSNGAGAAPPTGSPAASQPGAVLSECQDGVRPCRIPSERTFKATAVAAPSSLSADAASSPSSAARKRVNLVEESWRASAGSRPTPGSELPRAATPSLLSPNARRGAPEGLGRLTSVPVLDAASRESSPTAVLPTHPPRSRAQSGTRTPGQREHRRRSDTQASAATVSLVRTKPVVAAATPPAPVVAALPRIAPLGLRRATSVAVLPSASRPSSPTPTAVSLRSPRSREKRGATPGEREHRRRPSQDRPVAAVTTSSPPREAAAEPPIPVPDAAVVAARLRRAAEGLKRPKSGIALAGASQASSRTAADHAARPRHSGAQSGTAVARERRQSTNGLRPTAVAPSPLPTTKPVTPCRAASSRRLPLPSPPAPVPSPAAITAAPSIFTLSDLASHPAPASPGTRARPPSGHGEQAPVVYVETTDEAPRQGGGGLGVSNGERKDREERGGKGEGERGATEGKGGRVRGAARGGDKEGRRRAKATREPTVAPARRRHTSAPGNLEEAVGSARRAVEDLFATLRLEDTIVLDAEEEAEFRRQLEAYSQPGRVSDAETRGTKRYVHQRIHLQRSTANVVRGESTGSGAGTEEGLRANNTQDASEAQIYKTFGYHKLKIGRAGRKADPRYYPFGMVTCIAAISRPTLPRHRLGDSVTRNCRDLDTGLGGDGDQCRAYSDRVSSSLRLYSYRWGELPPSAGGGMAHCWNELVGSHLRGFNWEQAGGKDTSNKGIGGAMYRGSAYIPSRPLAEADLLYYNTPESASDHEIRSKFLAGWVVGDRESYWAVSWLAPQQTLIAPRKIETTKLRISDVAKA